jgi:hypothetical protein
MSHVRSAACRILAITCMALGAGGVLPAAAQTWHVSGGHVTVVCPLTVGGRFEARTTAVTGEVTVADGTHDLDGSFSVDLRTLDTGIGLRNTHLRDNYLEVSRGPTYDTAVLSEVILDAPAPPRGRSATLGFKGVLSVHGNARPIAGTAQIARKDDIIDVKVKFPLRIDAYEIARPAYLGVGVTNQIDVEVRATLKPAAARP